MDQAQKGKGCASSKDNPLPMERNSQKLSPSGRAADHNTSTQSNPLTSSHLNLLTSFGLSIDDLEELSHYPDDQLTPEKMPVLLQAIQKKKPAPKGPTLPSKSTEKETVSSTDGCGSTVKKKVIDYGHKSKYGYNEAPVEANASSTVTEESTKGVQAQQPLPVPAPAAAPSSISNPKKPTKELVRQVESKASTPNLQAFPLVDPAKKMPSAELGAPVSVPPVMPIAVPPTPPPVMPTAVPPTTTPVMPAFLPPVLPPVLMPAVNTCPLPFAPVFLSSHGRYEPSSRADPPNPPCQTMDRQKSFQKEAEDRVKSPFGVVRASWLPDFSQVDKQKEKKLPTAPQMCDYYAVTPRIFPHICSLCNENCIDKKDWIQHQNTLRHNENCRWLLQQHPEWAPKNPSSPKRHEDDRQERHESKQRSASPSPKCSSCSSCSHSRHRTRSRSRSSGRHRRSRPRSRSPRRLSSPRHRDDRQERCESRRCSASPSPKRSRYSSSARARYRSRSRSRSSGHHRTGRPRSRSPRYLPRPRHRSRSWSRSRSRSRSLSRSRSRSPWQSLRSGRWSQSSSSRESSTRSTGGWHQRAKTPHSQKRSVERNRPPKRSDCSLELSADEAGSQEQTHDKLGRGRPSREEPERSTLASLTEKSVLQAMAQLQAQGAADGALTQGRNSSEHAAKGTDTSAVSPTIISMIQQVATQVITAVLESREASTTQASRSARDPTPAQVHSVIKKDSSQSEVGPSPQQGTAESTEAKCQSQGSPCPKKGTSLSGRAENKHKADPCPKKSTLSVSKAQSKHAVSPSVQQGTAASGKEEKRPVVDQKPEQGVASSSKAANDSVAGPSSQQGTAASSKAENQGGGSKSESQGVSPQQDAAKSTEAKHQSQGNPCLSKGTSLSGKAENKDKAGSCPKKSTPLSNKAQNKCVVSPSVQLGTAAGGKEKNQSVVGASPQQGTAVCNKSEIQGVSPWQDTAKSPEAKRQSQGSPCPNKGTSSSSRAENNHKAGLCPKKSTPSSSKAQNEHAVSPSVQQDPAASSEVENQGVVGADPQQGTAICSKPENQGLSPQQGTPKSTEAKHQSWWGLCPKEGTTLSSKAKNERAVSPSVQQGTAESGKAEKRPVVHQQLEQDFASTSKAANDSVAGLSPQQGTATNSKAEKSTPLSSMTQNEHEVSPSVQQDPAASSKVENQGVVGADPQQGTAMCSKPENQGLSPQQGMPKSTEAKHQSWWGLCPKEGTTLSSKAKNERAVSPSVQQGTAESGKAEKRPVVHQQLEQDFASTCKAANDSVAGLSPQQGTATNSKAENQGVASCSLNEGTAGNSEAESLTVADPVPNQGTAVSDETENKSPGVPSSQQGKELVPGSLCPGTPGQASKPRVCIYGDALVVSAQKRASSSTAGLQLGLEEMIVMEWHGQENMTWAMLVPAIQKLAAQGQAPDVLIFHLRGDDLVYTMEFGLFITVKKTLLLLRELLPQVKVIWSEIIPQGIWHGVKRREQRDKLNTAVGESFKSYGGGVIQHPRLSSEDPELYTDKANLSHAGLDTFLEDLKNGILAHLCLPSRALGGHLSSSMRLPPPSPAAPTGLASVSRKVAAQEDEVVLSSKVESSTLVRPQPVSSKAKASDVADPSPQPGTSGPCKAENTDVEQKLVAGSIPPCPATCKQAAKPCVWICGDSLVVSAQKWNSQKRLFGELDWLQQSITLEWHGQKDLTWTQLVPLLQKLAAQGPAPDVLIVHLGEKDLLRTPWPELSGVIKKEVVLLREVFPNVRLMWSEMLPQNLCPVEGDASKMEQVLQEANSVVGGFISESGGIVIKHVETSNTFPVLNIHGGSLSHVGLDLFLEDIKNAVRAHVLQSSRAASDGLKEGKKVSLFAPSAVPAGLMSMSQEVAVQEDQVGSSSKEALQIPRNTKESAVSSQAASWVSHREKLQVVGQKHIFGKFPFDSGSSGHSSDSPGTHSKSLIWICGDSMVIAAQKRASSTAAGSHLGLKQSAVLEWHGLKNLKWIQLLPFLQKLVSGHRVPDVLIIHLGEKDLVRALDHDLMDRVKREWLLLRRLFPKVRVIWSELIPQGIRFGQDEFFKWTVKTTTMERSGVLYPQFKVIWPKTNSQGFRHQMEKYRKWTVVNQEMGSSIKSYGGHVIGHPRILFEDPKLYLDKATMSNAGLDIFLEDIRNGILAHVLQPSRVTGGALKEGKSLPPPASPAAPAGLASGTSDDKVVSSSEEASSMQTSKGEATVRIKVENFGVACPNPQPGTSETCKKKRKTVKQKLVFENIPLCSGSVRRLSKLRIWICGHAMVNAAQERAATTSLGSQLGLEKQAVLEWYGWRGMMWVHLIPFLQDLVAYNAPPDVLIIHLGENDLMYTLDKSLLLKTIQRELFLVKELFPSVKVVWSEMMPWGSGSGLPSAADKEGSLKNMNRDVEQYLKDHGGAVIKHCRFSLEDRELYTDQAKLSGAGLDVFLKDLKNGILAHVLQSSRAASGGLQEGLTLAPPASPAAPASLASKSRKTVKREGKIVSSTKEASSMQTKSGESAVSSQPVSVKAEPSDVAGPSPQPGASGPSKAESTDVEHKLEPGSIPPCPGEAAVGSQPVSIKEEDSSVASPSPQPGTSGPCKAENTDEEQKLEPGSIPPCPEAAVGSQPVTVKVEDSGVTSPSPQPGTSGPCKAENTDVEQKLEPGSIPPCPGEAAVGSQPVTVKVECSGVASPSPQPGTSGPCKAENTDVEHKLEPGSIPPCPGEAALSFQPVTVKVEGPGGASPSPQPGTSGPCKAEDTDVEQKLEPGSIPPCPGEAAVGSQPVSIKVEDSGVASPSPQPGTSGPCKAENTDVEQKLETGSIPPCPGEAAVSFQPVTVKVECSGVASPSPQPGTSGPCKAENTDVEHKLEPGSIPPCPEESGLSSQAVTVKAETSDAASPNPQPGTSGPCKAENTDVEQQLEPGSIPPLPGEAAVGSQPVSIKVEDSSVASPSPQPGTSGPCKAENTDEEQKLEPGSIPPCPEAAVGSQPVTVKVEDSGVTSPSPQPGTSGPCKAENTDVEQKLEPGSIPPCPGEAAVGSQPVTVKVECSGVASPSPQPGTSGPCKAENTDVEHKLEPGSIPPCPGEAAVGSQPVYSQEENSDVGSPSPQPGPCKAENTDLEQKLLAASIPLCSGDPEQASKRRVWICGQSVVVSAKQQASSTGAGSQLGLEEDIVLEWHGQEDLTWTQLVPTLQRLADQGHAPDMLVVHLGENDLECNRGAQLTSIIKKELALVKELFPQVRILWSNLLLRRRGVGKAGSRTVNRARTLVNLEMRPFVSTLGGAVMEHPAILHTDPNFYIDGDNLSCRGLDIFLEDVKNGILSHLHS